MKHKKRARRRRPEPVPERDDVKAARNRCPYCHDRIAAKDSWLICEQCLGRHHDACWEELGRCASCACTRRLRRRKAKLKQKQGTPALPIVGAGAVLMLALLLVAALIHSNNQNARRIEQERLARIQEAEERLRAEELARKDRLHEETLRQAALERMVLTDRVKLDEATERDWETEVLAGRERERKKLDETLRKRQIDGLMRAAKRNYHNENYARALDRYRSVLEVHPNHAPAHSSIGAILLRLGEYEAAIEACGKALECDPKLVVARVTRASARQLSGDPQGAIADLDAAILLEPHQLEAINNRGVIQRQLGRFEEALADFDRALTLSKADLTATLNRAEVLDALGRQREALEGYARFLELSYSDHPQRERVTEILREAEKTVPPGWIRRGYLSFDGPEDWELDEPGDEPAHEALARGPEEITPAEVPSANAKRARPRAKGEVAALLGLLREAERRQGSAPLRLGLR